MGATGARITGKAAELLVRENKKYALATQCIGYGMGIATVIEVYYLDYLFIPLSLSDLLLNKFSTN